MIPWHPIEEERCCECTRKAVWFYMPSGEPWQCCDEHVPRGCSCNEVPVDDWDGEGEYTGEWTQDTDEQGRFYPCCEWCYDDGVTE